MARPCLELSFDRGTLVLESRVPEAGPERRGVRQALPAYFLWDRRVGCWRAPAYRLAAFRAWLRQQGIESVYHSARPAGFAPSPVPAQRLPGLRPYQEESLRAWTAAGHRGLVSLPTGTGKTRVALWAMFSLARPALVVAPTRHLLRQWVAAIREFYPGPVGIYGDGERELQPLTVATFESAYIHLDRVGDHFDMLVVDEAHHFASRRLGEIAQMTTASHRMGLSATFPSAFNDVSEKQSYIEDLLGPLCFSMPVARLSGKYLSTVEAKVIPLCLSREERERYDLYRQRFLLHFRPFVLEFPEASWADFARAASRSPGGRQALAALRRCREITSLPRAKINALDQLLDMHSSERTLVFTADKRAAYEVSRRFLIPTITCEIERKERENILSRFADGTYRALVSARVLNEGIDVPAASVAVVVGGSSSPLAHAQRLGRVLRPQPGKTARVYELVVVQSGDWTASEKRSRPDVLGGTVKV